MCYRSETIAEAALDDKTNQNSMSKDRDSGLTDPSLENLRIIMSGDSKNYAAILAGCDQHLELQI